MLVQIYFVHTQLREKIFKKKKRSNPQIEEDSKPRFFHKSLSLISYILDLFTQNMKKH